MVLTGLMGAGKTTFAGALASRLGVRAGDTDQTVEGMCGMSVAAIFGEAGEARFRELEIDAVQELLRDGGPEIIALGGGAYMSAPVRQACRDRGAWVVYLHADPEELAERLSSTDTALRPLLADGLRERMRSLYRERDATYRQADVVVETGGRAVADVVDELARIHADRCQ